MNTNCSKPNVFWFYAGLCTYVIEFLLLECHSLLKRKSRVNILWEATKALCCKPLLECKMIIGKNKLVYIPNYIYIFNDNDIKDHEYIANLMRENLKNKKVFNKVKAIKPVCTYCIVKITWFEAKQTKRSRQIGFSWKTFNLGLFVCFRQVPFFLFLLQIMICHLSSKLFHDLNQIQQVP